MKYLVDVGFGGSMIKPIALKEAQYDQPPFTLGLEKLDDHYWRFWENLGAGKFSFDFTEDPACESLLAKKMRPRKAILHRISLGRSGRRRSVAQDCCST